jgi:hypothetical protein
MCVLIVTKTFVVVEYPVVATALVVIVDASKPAGNLAPQLRTIILRCLCPVKVLKRHPA